MLSLESHLCGMTQLKTDKPTYIPKIIEDAGRRQLNESTGA